MKHTLAAVFLAALACASPAAHQTAGEIDFIHSVALTPNGCLYDVTFFSAAGAGKTNNQNGDKHMKTTDKYVGLDVHKDTTVIAVAEGGREGEVRLYGSIASDLKALENVLRKLAADGARLHVVYEADIKGFFDNIDHDLLMLSVERHVEEKWIKMYIRRWLLP